jgi:hypothetical protein
VLSAASSGVLVQTVLLVPTRALLRLSVIKPIFMPRDISPMTPRNQAVSPYPICVSVRKRSVLHILIDEADYIACHNQSYVGKYDLIDGLKKGGTLYLNCQWSEAELEEKLPADPQEADC